MLHRKVWVGSCDWLPVTYHPRATPAVGNGSGDPIVMESVNFEFLRKKPDWEPLADLSGFAERYARPDPVAALVKLRGFGEVLVSWIYDSLKLPRPLRATFHDLLINDAF